VLFQLPPGFKKDAPVLAAFLEEIPDGMRPAFEFRHASWFDDEVYNVLRRRNAALCIADSEKLATPAVVTADFGYLRLRREDYQEADIRRWSESIRTNESSWHETFIFFKHEESGVGPKFAASMQSLLAESAPAAASEEKTQASA
jgi:uncharacterized protein YecE (DUF72 family)